MALRSAFAPEEIRRKKGVVADLKIGCYNNLAELPEGGRYGWDSVVVFLAKMGDQVFADHPAQGVLQLH